MPALYPLLPTLPTLPLAGLEAYRAIEESSRHMVAAAQAAQWARFWQLGVQCREQVQALQQPALQQPVSPADCAALATAAQRSEKHAILLRILQNDALIRALTEPGTASTGALRTGCVTGGLVSTQLH